MAISEHRPMLTAITRYVHTKKRNELHFDYIFFASGTGTTQAGLVCGQIMHGDERNRGCQHCQKESKRSAGGA